MEGKIDWNYLALTALAQYNVGAAELVFLGHSENVTFRVDTENDENYTTSKVLRIPSSDRSVLRSHLATTRCD